ncbi:MAG: hypothetical protein L0K86_26700, partial [Actinomycetia bacterium]|nr:hypothetical protein [Actinomycetes bacterium]
AAPVAPAPVGDDDDQDLRPAAAPDTEDDSSENSSRPRSGGSGHACLPGERDGDGDGYCGEG